MIFYSCVLNKTLHDALHAYTLCLLFLVHLCLFASVDSSMHMRPPTPPPPPPHFITFDDLFPGAVEGFAPLLKSTEAELLSSFAGGRAFLQNHDMLLTTSGVHVWFIVTWQTWGKTIVSDPAGIFMSSAYKADFGYYGKSSKNSWNWRYAAWLLRVSLVFQRSEIFLNFATQPSLLPITSPCPPAQIQTPDLLHPVTVCREQQGESNAARGTRTHGSSSRELSWGMKMFEIWDQRCMIPRLGMWPPRAQQFILRHASGFWSPATFFLSHFQSVSALRPGSDIHPGLLCTLFFPPLPLGSVVNLKMRLREQILKHRSAFHTLFRKNSPSEGEMSLCFHPYFQPLRFFFSSFFFYRNMKVTHSWVGLMVQPEYIFLLVPFRLWFWFQFPQEEAELEHSRQTWESDYIWVSVAAALASDYKPDDVTQHVKGPKHDC